jgi:hypothetical protein
MTLKTTPAAMQQIPNKQQLETEGRCFLCGPCRYVITRAISESWCREMKSWLVSYCVKNDIVIFGVESNWVHSALRPPTGLLCQSRVIMMMEKVVESLAGETEVLGRNLPQCRFVHHKPHTLPGREPGPPR